MVWGDNMHARREVCRQAERRRWLVSSLKLTLYSPAAYNYEIILTGFIIH